MFKRIILAVFLLPLLSGCVVWVDDKSDLKQFVAQAKARPAGRIEPLPEYKPYESFVYEGGALREPFVPLQPIQVVNSAQDKKQSNNLGLKPDMERSKSYLEEFALDDLKMVGTITNRGRSQLLALIKDTNKAIHRINVGDYMGLDYGKVTAINEYRIELVEIISNGRGGWMEQRRTLALKEAGGRESDK